MRPVTLSFVALSAVLCFSSSALAELTARGAKSAWGKAMKSNSTISASMKGMSKLGLSPEARGEVKAALKKTVLYGPVGKTILTLKGKGTAANQTFAVRINAPGFDTYEFVARQLTKVFDRVTGKPLATHKVTWDANEILFDGWEK